MVINLLDVIPYEQQSKGYCGPACLKMVLGYYGIIKEEEELAELAGCTPRHGVSGEGLLEAAQYYGLEGKIQDNSSMEDLREAVMDKKIPVIVDWFSLMLDETGYYSDGHYSVVVGLDTANVYFIDPEIGQQRSLKRRIFRRLWFDFSGDYLQEPDDLILRRMIILHQPQEEESRVKDRE